MSGEIEYEGFYAICDHMPGKERALRIGGTVVVPTTGWTARIDPYEGLPPVTPFLLELNLTVTAPEHAGEDVVTRIELDEEQLKPPPLEFAEVQFNFTGPEGAQGPGTITVDHPE
jgi:hypothetical protein